jgi:hypothetical protein
MDSYCSSPDLFHLLNKLYANAVRTVRSNRKGLLKDAMNCKLKKEVAVSFGNKLMALKWKNKRDVCMLNSIHDDEMKTVGGKKGRAKQKPKMCFDYSDAMGGADISDQYLVMYSMRRWLKKCQKIFCQFSFQLICNTQETWWHINALTVSYGNNSKVISEVQRSSSPSPPEAMPVRPVKSLPLYLREAFT